MTQSLTFEPRLKTPFACVFAAGQACEKNKSFDKAREYYDTVVQKYPDDSLVAKAQKYRTAIEFK